MRADPMKWVQRLVGLVFVIGLVGIGAAMATMISQAEGVPPLPVYLGLLGLVLLILLAGACLALISLAITVGRSAEALQRIAAAGGTNSGNLRPFSSGSLREVAAGEPEPDTRPARPAGRKLVAER